MASPVDYIRSNDYIKNHCSGLFTMGHWLREWLIEQGVDANLVHAVGGGTTLTLN